MSAKLLIQDRIANSAARIQSSSISLAKVTAIDESNNTCDIIYDSKAGLPTERRHVPVRLYGKGIDWFPKVDEQVLVEDNGIAVSVIARHVGNYSMDIRSKRQLRQDIFSDDSGCQAVGGYIM